MRERGAISLPIVIAAVLGIGFGASIFLNMVQHQRAEQERKLLQGQITDLTYQVKKDSEQSPSTSPTPEPLATPEATVTPTPTPAVAGTASMSINEYEGVKLTTIEPVADLTYKWVKSGVYQVAELTTRSLIGKYASCVPSSPSKNNALGLIVRRPIGEKAPSQDILPVSIDSWTYYYVKPSTTSCATDTAGKNEVAAARAAVLNSVYKTLSK